MKVEEGACHVFGQTPRQQRNQILRSEARCQSQKIKQKTETKVCAISQTGVLSKGQTKTKREQQDLNTISKQQKRGGSAAQEESSTVSRPSNKLHNKSLTPGLTTQLPVLSSATGVLGYW